jgi:Restriction endonuclease BglII
MLNRFQLSVAIDNKFVCSEWRNGLAILESVHAGEWTDIVATLDTFTLKHSHVAAKGRGNKSEMAGSLDGELYRRGWIEKAFDTSVSVDGEIRPSPTHSIDCFKNRVALEVEWNNKDPFYDRDLNNFRLLYELNAIDVGVVITRTTALQEWLHQNRLLFGKKSGTYGTSTTHEDKLIPRILGGGAGGCPLVVLAIKPAAYEDDQHAP